MRINFLFTWCQKQLDVKEIGTFLDCLFDLEEASMFTQISSFPRITHEDFIHTSHYKKSMSPT